MYKKLNIWPSFTFLLPVNVSYFSCLVGRLIGRLVSRWVSRSVAIIGVSTSNKFIMYLQFNYL